MSCDRRRQPRRAPHRLAGRHRDRAARYRRPQRRGAGDRRQGAELFAEPRRIIDADEAIELLTATLPDLDTGEVRERLSATQGLRLAEARDHAEAAARNPPARHSRHRLPAREQARLSDRRRGRAPDRPRQYRQPGHRRHGEMARQQRPCRSASRRLRHRSPAAPVELSIDLRVQHACATNCSRPRKNSTPRRRRPRLQRQDRRNRGDGVGAGFRSQQSERGARSRPHQPPDHRRLRNGLDLQGASRWRWRWIPARPISTRCAMRAAPLHYGKFTIHDTHRRAASSP